ncbi:hypothetical protein A2962_01640 [Candidatus Woesebacteria bacterium RIFCSPLOWO2_01_FULL_39_61]|uniref:Uncharacterized protein n=1 Tax=Candidatus Woesebacteria bacterium RIFCSPHIGHO2_02_FULL_39_13 TaxID=1802505 RepID=A0A1F7Z4S9_9BACT|nr:MAG: hypothetical protein A2692_01880 [Candidatus Woesebacteria bacterium RIFCSPHIGHO2_01_FULL_39_95]OGM34547.1 MAG: hypothetical protein A3D01_03330 [Candidatus Woesebacteria bacterium RIFCSPHIGHO2_02_FULL_39_13]OGM38814.1 MAG: hypothetical protein A3E13_01225 [Candidatus Woesebacteria bacterium RIFCSPHIGHO2_12_FULL_40_20]OGM65820.1 MAG: hypothetical protein A2962_01640 [Candidatus Woesebacteria bacterium RIFCSPLOWO2_01_FULL_39_61]OGM71633.1 MAG: hypothetical protein A3H19_04940 [Candidatus
MAIPFLSTPDKTILSTTQDLIPLADIVDGVVIYKNGGAAQIMESTSLNFGLLSENEQEAVIASYAGLLNSFNFPVQIVVRSQKKDISIYMNFLNEAQSKINNPKLIHIMEDYKNFIAEAIKKKNVLSKKFYIVVSFSPFELGLGKSLVTTFRPSKKGALLPFPKSYVVRKAKIALFPKREHLARQARRLNIQLKPLSNEDLIRLFYNTYNPEPPVKEMGILG